MTKILGLIARDLNTDLVDDVSVIPTEKKSRSIPCNSRTEKSCIPNQYSVMKHEKMISYYDVKGI